MALVAMPAFAQNIATVNGKPVPQSRVDTVVRQLVAGGKEDTPYLRSRVSEQVIAREALAQEAKNKGMHKLDDVKGEIAMMTESILINAMRQDFLKKHPVTDADIKAEYDRLVKLRKDDKEYHAYHILVDEESEAKSIIAKLKSGGSFSDLAKQSKDAGSAKNGGDLGWASPNRFVKPFAEAVASMTKGKISDEPVKTRFGYHVIKLEDVRKAKVPTLEQAKMPILQRLQAQRLGEFEQKIVSRAKIAPIK